MNDPAYPRGFTTITVLPELTGVPLGPIVDAYVSALRPTSVRICRGFQNDDAKCWRVSVWVDAKERVERIVQEVAVTLPEGIAHGAALSVAMKRAKAG